MEQVKKISPSQIVKFLFPDAYKDVPEWILEKASEFGKDLHEIIQAYIDFPNLDQEIKEALITDNKIKLYKSFKKWYSEQGIKEPKTEHFIETDINYGFVDLLDDKYKFKFWDYKFRNVDKKLDITKDIVQMKVYEMMLKNVYGKAFSWELVIFDKKTAKIFTFNGASLTIKQNQELETLINNAIKILKQKQELQEFKKDDLQQWEPWIITDLKYQAYLKDGDPGDR